MRVDMHIHTNTSDGDRSVPEIIDIAFSKKLDAIAITDHDTLAHLNYVPKNPKVPVIAGVEISAVDKNTGIKADVLGYGVRDPDLIEKLTIPMLEQRHEISLRQIAFLQKCGSIIELDKLKKADGKYIYAQHITEYLIETNQYNDIGNADIDYVDVRDAVNVIKKAGGLAVLAHPGRQKNFYMVGIAPFDGIEFNHPSNSMADKAIIKAYACKHNLFLTGGSDFHGKYDDMKVEIGDYLMPYGENQDELSWTNLVFYGDIFPYRVCCHGSASVHRNKALFYFGIKLLPC